MVPHSKNLTKIFQKNPKASILWLGKKCELKAREFLSGHILSLFHENRDYLHNLTQYNKFNNLKEDRILYPIPKEVEEVSVKRMATAEQATR
jgi:hypothetical protein